MKFAATGGLVKAYVMNLFMDSTQDYMLYHNLSHTEKVVGHTMEIVRHYQLNERERFVLNTAAWFHDTGHMFASIEVHEEAGVHIMRSFLEKEHAPGELIEMIAQCIMATKYPPTPGNQLEEIICDADTYHFGTPEFRITDELIKKEMQLRTGKEFKNWYQDSMKLLESHRFFTSYCRYKLEAGKQQNIQYLQAKIKNS
ncbi:HD domain-containing protein [Chitinophaga niabensis]|uniref:HD domain-containing protein n=1 Tax=Chitinophaga niabensis TaxID=536979 RepID=A0A1N6JPX1_9BACT|nr:HD domain-containing protein [Chitinophaga niabensis]SIO46444.1 HD domain-containing protein [Chitinophaga niabensis]